MGRPVMLGNGQLTVGLNEQGLVHDFYYPYVGLDNLNTSRNINHKVGVWVDGSFSWTDDGTWVADVNFESDALVSDICMRSETLGIELQFNDFVDSDHNAFCRLIKVSNLRDDEREIRVFMHQAFQISRAGRADTALFVPDDNYILDYKGNCCLLIYGEGPEDGPFDQFAIGNYGIEGKEGTYRDAEDGELSCNAVEHGGVDSVIRYTCSVKGNDNLTLKYWIIAADSQFSGEKTLIELKKIGAEASLKKTRNHWRKWLGVATAHMRNVEPRYQEAVKKSLMVIKAHVDKRGGIIASCDSSIYNYGRDYYSYVWPRDGAYAIWPLIKLGYTEEPKRFFEFCRDILTPEGYLMHKYQPDRTIGSTWHPLLHNNRKELALQEDETAIVVYMLGEYLKKSGDKDFVRGLYETLVQPAGNFMANFIDKETNLPHASYDLWEQKFLTNTYTAAVVYGALLVAAEMADKLEFPYDVVRWRKAAQRLLKASATFFDPERKAYIKGFLLQGDDSLQLDNTLDVSSLYGVDTFGFYNKQDTVQQTQQAVENTLLDKSPSGGAPRYENDGYFASEPSYLGNPWFVTTLWMAQYYARHGQADKAKSYVDWALAHTLPSGVLSEQIHPVGGTQVSVAPLVWSHAELINTVLDVFDKNNLQKSA